MHLKSRVLVLGVLISLALGSVAFAGPGSPAEDAPAPTLNERIRGVFDAASAFDAESQTGRVRRVPSPYTVVDQTGDGQPFYHPRADITVYQARNGPEVMDLRFWILRRPDTWNTAVTGAVIRIDVTANGPGNDYDVIVVSSPQTGKVAIVGRAGFQPGQQNCVSPNVTDLGSSQLGYGYRVRFRFDCIDLQRAFRTRMAFVYSWFNGDPTPTVDVAPSTTWTPSITPRR